MKLQIDNFDGSGPRDYTPAIDSARMPRVVRKLNQPAELQVSLVANGADFVVPANGARVTLGRTNGQDVFTGYLMQAPIFEYLGWGERGPVYRYNLVALSDEAILDRKRLPDRSPFVDRSAGNALRQITTDLLPGVFDTTAVQDVDTLASYAPDPQKKWTYHAAEIALEARGSYRASAGTLIFAPVGAVTYALNETDANFSPAQLLIQPVDGLINDVTVLGMIEPQAYVKDYFIGDGLTLRFYLSQTPFVKTSQTLVDEEYVGTALDATRWQATDPSNAVSVSGGQLQIAGGTGTDGATTVVFAESVELGGGFVLQHGNVTFASASSAVLGGLYPGAISIAGCLAGFRITPNGSQCNIQALINGAAVGTPLATVAGHEYALTTRFYSREVYRRQQIFHSPNHPAGSGFGGASVAADLRIVLELHDIDPNNPASLIAASTVLYDNVISSAPGFCTYALVNAANLNCSIAFTRIIQAVDAEVQSAPNGTNYSTRLVGALSDGAECTILSSGELEFFTSYVPASGEAIVVRYRGQGRAVARVTDPASISAQQNGSDDDGIRAVLRHLQVPAPRTAADCEFAALALMDGVIDGPAAGEYDTWSDFLPGNAQDIFPGDALQVNVPSRVATFTATVRQVEIDVRDLEGEHSNYKIQFADDVAIPLAVEFTAGAVKLPVNILAISTAQVGNLYLSDLTAAELTDITSTSVSVDAGTAAPAGGGFEVRWSDTGWGPGNDRNLVGRFNTQNLTLPRVARVQNYYLRQYDASSPPKYSRYTTALHIDSPLT